MNTKNSITSLLIGIAPCALAQTTPHPNIIFILADDMGYGDVSSLNEQGKIKTPNIDQLSEEGVTFTDAHSSSAVSTPSRYSILTGRYNWRSRLKRGVLPYYAQGLIPNTRTTMPSMLRNQGYQTACIGKWHLGMEFATSDGKVPTDTEETCNVDFSKEIKGGPREVGFDYFFGVDCPNYPPYCFLENRHTTQLPTVYYPKSAQMDSRAGRGMKDWNLENVLPGVMDKAIDFIDNHANKENPFFLYLPLTSPHTPIVPTKEFKGKSGLNLYADFVMQTDDCVGKVLEALKKNGITENTIVVFTADNGCSPRAEFNFLSKHGHNPSYIFRGMKADLYEGGHHIPCVVRWPARIKPHKVKQTICLADFMATFAHLTDYKLADNEAEDSYNILPLLVNTKEDKTIREATVHHSIDGCFAIRQGKWKLLVTNYSGGWSAPSKKNPYAEPYQLYDLSKDPQEKVNLYASHPEKVEELRQLLENYVRNGRSTPGLPQLNDKVASWTQLSPWMTLERE